MSPALPDAQVPKVLPVSGAALHIATNDFLKTRIFCKISTFFLPSIYILFSLVLSNVSHTLKLAEMDREPKMLKY